MTPVDLALHAASLCRFCRSGERPSDESSPQDQGDVFVHRRSATSAIKCEADQIWVLIRKLEAEAKKGA